MKKLILNIVDFFYPPFKKLITLETFRYAACGGFNTALDIVIFFICYNFVFDKEVVHMGSLAISAPIAAFLTAFLVTFPVGFYLSRYVVFSNSSVRGRTQLLRYFLLVLGCIALNYMFLKFFVEILHIYPTVSKIITTVIVVAFSYVMQKHFTFKTKVIKLHVMDANAAKQL